MTPTLNFTLESTPRGNHQVRVLRSGYIKIIQSPVLSTSPTSATPVHLRSPRAPNHTCN